MFLVIRDLWHVDPVTVVRTWTPEMIQVLFAAEGPYQKRRKELSEGGERVGADEFMEFAR